MFFLVDCNQFFVSCERVFRPDLQKQPVVVLSNNDGCVIARSSEVKALGVPMGAPYFAYKGLFQQKGVHVFSSNFSLYGDFSRRVMEVLLQTTPDVEVYSIDEAFLWIEGAGEKEALALRETIERWTAIPVSIGIGPTKTLAKLASDMAKDKGFIYTLKGLDPVLSSLGVGDVWGIGKKSVEKLARLGIFSAKEFAEAEPQTIRKALSVTGLKTMLELQGRCCLGLEEVCSPQKGIMCSRSFGQRVYCLEALKESLCTYTAKAAEKMRKQGLCCSFLQVMLIASPFSSTYRGATRSAQVVLSEPTLDTPTLMKKACALLEPLYQEGVPYKKTLIYLGGLVDAGAVERGLFAEVSEQEAGRQKRCMACLDVAKKKGYSLQFLSEGLGKQWAMQQDAVSPRYTTSWKELKTIRI